MKRTQKAEIGDVKLQVTQLVLLPSLVIFICNQTQANRGCLQRFLMFPWTLGPQTLAQVSAEELAVNLETGMGSSTQF